MSMSFDIDSPDRVTVGTVGVPGQRTFFLQAREGARTVSLKLEKQQVGALARLLTELLSDLPTPGELPTDLDLEEPVTAEWAVGTMQLSYDNDTDRILVVAEELIPRGEEVEDPAVGRLAITRPQAAALIGRSAELIEAGRPPCPLCGFPLDPSGHSCPRTNGHGPPKL